MVEQRKLKLDQPASEILPDLASAQVLEGFDAAGTPQLRPAKRPITLRQLLTHTAGYTYDIWNENTGRYEKQANLPKLITCKDDALKTPLAFDPGDRWEYGINIDFAGKMVEKVSGERLESYFHEHIFGPLGMADTSFKLSPNGRSSACSASNAEPKYAATPAWKATPLAVAFPPPDASSGPFCVPAIEQTLTL
jgi:CubicO group peptidase (beta-lactamase class C family)